MCNGAGPREQQLKKNWDAKNPNEPFPISPTNKQEPGKTLLTKSAPLGSTTTMNKNTTKKRPINKGSKEGTPLLIGTSDYS